jgi:hypothetical protein
LRKLGYSEIAKIVEKHGVAKEIAEYENMEGDFEPKTPEEKLLVYADTHVIFKPIPFEERMDGLKEKYMKKDPIYLKLLEKGESRIRKIVEEIDKLLGG